MLLSREFLADAAERIAWTFVYAAIQALVLVKGYDVESLKAAVLSAIPVALVTAKTLLASKIGNPDDAAIRPKDKPTPDPDPAPEPDPKDAPDAALLD